MGNKLKIIHKLQSQVTTWQYFFFRLLSGRFCCHSDSGKKKILCYREADTGANLISVHDSIDTSTWFFDTLLLPFEIQFHQFYPVAMDRIGLDWIGCLFAWNFYEMMANGIYIDHILPAASWSPTNATNEIMKWLLVFPKNYFSLSTLSSLAVYRE